MLLHVCCAPCACSVVERLLSEGENVTLFYYNPNTYPYDEHEKRFENVIKLAEHYKLNLISPVSDESDYEIEHAKWLDYIKGIEDYKNLPEGSARCELCYKFRLEKTFEFAKEFNFKKIATTLGMGPMKPINKINGEGIKLAKKYEIKFVNENFRKKDGHNRSIKLSNRLKLYRQTYCGCEFSLR